MIRRRSLFFAAATSCLMAPWLLYGCGPPRLKSLVIAPGLTSSQLATGGLVLLPVTCAPGLHEPAVLSQLTNRLGAVLRRKRPVLHPLQLTDAPDARAPAIRMGAQAVETGRAEPASESLRSQLGGRYLVACHVTGYNVVQDSEMRDRQVSGKTEPYTVFRAEATMTARIAVLDLQTGAACFRAEHIAAVKNEQESRHETLLGEVLSAFEGGLKPKVAEVGEKLFSEAVENLPA